jgi:pimeloyl-ACP methyl ester carboxylesterase
VLVLHGAGVDHREAEACFEPVFDDLAGLRRIYLDLPGMGRTAAPENLCSADDVLEALLNFAEEATGVRRTSSSGTRRAPTTPRRWQPSAPPWLLVWHWSVRCCQGYVTFPSTAASPAR